VARGDQLALLDKNLLAVLDIELGFFALEAFGHQLKAGAVVLELEHVLLVEHFQHLLVVVTQRAQQDRRRQFAAAVNTDEDVVLGVKLEVQPGTAIRNDAGAVQQLAGAVSLALVVIEEHAGRAVQLADDDTLGAVDHESAVAGHQRHFAEIDFLLAHVLDLLFLGLAIEDHQTHGDLERRGVGHATDAAFLLLEHRLVETVFDELQRRGAVVRHHREHRLERGLQAAVAALGRLGFFLQKVAVGIKLGGQQERNFQRLGQLAEILADTLLLGKRVGHGCVLVKPSNQKLRAMHCSGVFSTEC
jgi:hypothetical protein